MAESPLPVVPAPVSRIPNHYDSKIKKASKTYLPAVDWRLYKAQLYQESLMDPDAVSPAGAQGIAQFMPATWREVSAQLGFAGAVPTNAGLAIVAGAYYMMRMRQGWTSPRPEIDRHNLAMASYNAGLGNLYRAQRVCDGALLYPDIIKCLPQVTGHHSRETITYVKRIRQFYLVEVAA